MIAKNAIASMPCRRHSVVDNIDNECNTETGSSLFQILYAIFHG